MRIEWEILKLACVAIETHELASLSEDARKLIHDAAVAANILMLGSLTSENDVPLANLVSGKEVVESTSETTLQGS